MPKCRKIDFLGIIALLLFLIPWCPAPALAQVDVVTQHNNNQRTGANLNEAILNTSNVNSQRFGKLFTRSVDDLVFAQPLYLSDLTINDDDRNVVFVATEHNSVYAFDADDPNASQPLWHVNLGTPVPGGKLSGIGIPFVGITATPVIDRASGTLYVVPMTIDGLGNCHHFLHALDIKTGLDKPGSPVEITGSVPGNGLDNVDGIVTFNPNQQIIRPALLLTNNTLYIGSASYADQEPYHGWAFAYNATTLQQVGIFNTTPNGSMGGIWQSGNGMVADANGDVFVSTGNSAENTENAAGDRGESILKLSLSQSGLSVADFFEPGEFDFLNAQDLDLGSGGVLEMPDLGDLVAGGKQGVLYVVNPANLGGLSLGSDKAIQEFQACTFQIYGSPVYWNNTVTGPTVYVWGVDDFLKAYSMGQNSTFQTTPSSESSISAAYPGGSVSISANGSTPGTGILWAAATLISRKQSILAAYDATNLNTLLWSSQQNSISNGTGTYGKWVPPTIANGKVYVPNASDQLLVYGLLGGAFTLSGGPNAINLAPSSSANCVITINPTPGFSPNVTLSASNLPTGVTASFTPLTATTQQLTLTAGPLAAATYAQITVKGTAGAASSSIKLRVYVSAQPGMIFGPGLQLFSAPYDCSSVALDSLFGIANTTLAVWVPASGQYAITPSAPADHVRLGQGYWVRLPQQVTLTGEGAPADPSANFSIALGQGWNQIGNPFLSPVTLSSVQFDVNGNMESFATATTGPNLVVNPAIFGYDPNANSGKGGYYQLAVSDPLIPGQGYWINALVSTSLIVPHP